MLGRKYDVVAANPPYMGKKNMSEGLGRRSAVFVIQQGILRRLHGLSFHADFIAIAIALPGIAEWLSSQHTVLTVSPLYRDLRCTAS